MITNPSALRVLCFGDSNTHGTPSDDPEYVRLAPDVRWTGRLQILLGHAFSVIEEGLSGRTTEVDYDDRPGCNGRPYFGPCLLSHHPLDVVVVMLGTNDLKSRFARTAADVATALSGYVDAVAATATTRAGRSPVTVLVSPIRIEDRQPWFDELNSDEFGPAAVAEARRFAAEIERVARRRDAHFADAARVARPGRDGLHLSPDSHAPLASLLAATIKDLVDVPEAERPETALR